MQSWVVVCVEVAEICSKVLDWKIRQSLLGESVSQSFLLFLEELLIILNHIDSQSTKQYHLRV